MLRHAGWGVVLHTSAGVLLAGAIIAGAAVPGGVVAYQVAWVFFLAPYAIFSQPIHTAILPELADEASHGDEARYRTSVRWAADRIGLWILPISAAMVALAAPAMRVVSFGEASRGDGPELLAVALASLAIGLFPYSVFLLLSRAFYGRGDARTPGIVAIVVAAVGATILLVGAPLTDGMARIALIGGAHSAAHAVGAVILVVLLARRTATVAIPAVTATMAAVAAVAGGVAWWVGRELSAVVDGRGGDLAVCAAGGVAGATVVAAGYRLAGIRRRLTVRHPDPVHAVPVRPAP
jgi:putative peptidoglycan lipid II flippase